MLETRTSDVKSVIGLDRTEQGHLDQDLAVAIGLDQIPYRQPLLERQGFEDGGDVRRMEPVKLRAQLGRRAVVLQMLLHRAQVLLQIFDFEPRRRLVRGICAAVMRAEMVIIRPLMYAVCRPRS